MKLSFLPALTDLSNRKEKYGFKKRKLVQNLYVDHFDTDYQNCISADISSDSRIYKTILFDAGQEIYAAFQNIMPYSSVYHESIHWDLDTVSFIYLKFLRTFFFRN
jgi:hypothetical protein